MEAEHVSIPAEGGASGGMDRVRRQRLPDLTLMSSRGEDVPLHDLGPGLTVIYAYPMTGRPDIDPPDGWDEIPGARGCTSEACNFRDHYRELQTAGATHVFGLSSQTPEYQSEAVDRLHLPFDMLSDPDLHLADALQLPTFDVRGQGRLYERLTLIVAAGSIEHVFHPVLAPGEHAEQVLSWLRSKSI